MSAASKTREICTAKRRKGIGNYERLEIFKGGKWQDRIDVRDFIQKNYTPLHGRRKLLQPPTARTEKMLEKYEALCRAEQQNGGVLNIDTETVITATSFGPGYLDKGKRDHRRPPGR